MRMSRLFESTRLLYYALALLLMGHALQASGYDKTIEAVYKPDPNNPSQKTFVIVTPGEGHCAGQPSPCPGALGVRLPIVFESAAGIDAPTNALNPRQGAYLKIPLSWPASCSPTPGRARRQS